MSKQEAKTASSQQKKIDLEKIIASKNPRLLKFIPGFVLRYIKKVIHQNDVNAGLEEYGHLEGLAFVDAVLDKILKINIKAVGIENIPASGGCVIASNHPLGGIDGLALIKVVGTVRPDLKFIVNDILGNLQSLKGLWLEVNKHGSNQKESLEAIDAHYASGRPTLIFPAGLCSRKVNGKIVDLEWKKSFVGKAKKYKLPIVPTHINAHNSAFFYNLAVWRKRLGIKANVEMFYLVDEMFKQKNQTITITFGKPIQPVQFESLSDLTATEKIKSHVYALAKTPNAVFHST